MIKNKRVLATLATFSIAAILASCAPAPETTSITVAVGEGASKQSAIQIELSANPPANIPASGLSTVRNMDWAPA